MGRLSISPPDSNAVEFSDLKRRIHIAGHAPERYSRIADAATPETADCVKCGATLHRVDSREIVEERRGSMVLSTYFYYLCPACGTHLRMLFRVENCLKRPPRRPI